MIREKLLRIPAGMSLTEQSALAQQIESSGQDMLQVIIPYISQMKISKWDELMVNTAHSKAEESYTKSKSSYQGKLAQSTIYFLVFNMKSM